MEAGNKVIVKENYFDKLSKGMMGRIIAVNTYNDIVTIMMDNDHRVECSMAEFTQHFQVVKEEKTNTPMSLRDWFISTEKHLGPRYD